MARYDWPAPPRGLDRPGERAAHLTRFRTGDDPSGLDPASRAGGRRRRRAVAHTAPQGQDGLWLPIGPTVMTNGQAGGNPNVAGRITDLAVEPGKGQRLYASSAAGGVWLSTDRGQSWTPLDDFQESDLTDVKTISSALSCGAVHVIWGAQDDGSLDVVWVGTGEAGLYDGGLGPAGAGGELAGLPGGGLLGVGLLQRDPSVDTAWHVVKGDPVTTDPDTLRGHGFFRIVDDPADPKQLVAATSNGLYTKPAGGTWIRLPAWATGTATEPCDVVLTRDGANTLRIWVACASTLKVAELTAAQAAPIDNAALSFTAVGLPSVATNSARRPPAETRGGTRLALATDGTTVYVLGRRAATGNRANPPAALWQVGADAALAGLNATLLTGMPDDLFMSSGDQSDYDMAIAVDPLKPGRVYVGGATVGTASGWNGAVYRCDTTAAEAHPTYVGEGVHADIHVLRVWPQPPADAPKHTVWVGCDGGLFRSDADGDPGTFASRNDGLAVLEPGYVASHPTNPGIVAAGFQDNGTAVREGDSIWRQAFVGDGGGVIFDPAGQGRYFRQYIRADWASNDGHSVQPVLRRGLGGKDQVKSSETVEFEAALFYSGADALVHGDDTHLVLGSDRVWYSRDWGRSWVTLPTATDPRATRNVNLAQDVIERSPATPGYNDPRNSLDCCGEAQPGTVGPGIIAVKLMATRDDTDATDKLVLRVVAMTSTLVTWFVGTRPVGDTGAFTWEALTARRRQVIKKATAAELSVMAGGTPLNFLPAPGMVSDLCVHDPDRGTLGSVYVSATGDAAYETLWFFDGTNSWYPTGLRNKLAAWTTPADRVTSPALGVVVDPQHRDVVYVATAVGVVRGTLTIGGTPAAPTYSWAFERFMNGLPTTAVQDLSLFSSGGVRLLRAAMRSRGVWEVDLANSTTSPRTYLRLYPTDTRRILPTQSSGATLNGDPHGPAFADDSPDVVIDTTGTIRTAPPTEAELAKMLPPGSPQERERQSTSEQNIKIHVLIHHRWSVPLPKASVKVALLRHDLPEDGVVPIGQLWPGLVDVAAPGAAEPATLQDGWSKAATSLWLSPAADVDTRVPRAVTFDVNLNSVLRGTAVVFLAVVMSEPDQISAADLSYGQGNNAQTYDQLVACSPHVGARSLQVD
jgi:hypothetical protein